MQHIKKGTTARPSKYERSLKRKVMSELLSGTITKAELKRKYNLCSPTVDRWLVWYEKDQQQILSLQHMGESENKLNDQGDTPTPEELKALREELDQARKKVVCLETLIDLTEQDLGIDIRKNAGTRSSTE
jgi:transposase-like protein